MHRYLEWNTIDLSYKVQPPNGENIASLMHKCRTYCYNHINDASTWWYDVSLDDIDHYTLIFYIQDDQEAIAFKLIHG